MTTSNSQGPHEPMLHLVPNNTSLELSWAEAASKQSGSESFRAPPMAVLSLWAEKLLETSALLEGEAVRPVPKHFQLLMLWQRAIEEADADRGNSPEPGMPARLPSDLRAVAREAMEAERLLVHSLSHPRAILEGRGPDVGEPFGNWQPRFRRLLLSRGWLTAHEQLLCLVERLEQTRPFPIPLPQQIELCGFPELTRLEHRFFEALQRRDVTVANIPGGEPPSVTDSPAIAHEVYVGLEDEGRGAAAWAQAQRTKGRARVAVAVNGLAASADRLERVFLQTFHPEAPLNKTAPEPCEFHLSIGPSAVDHPLIQSALLLLGLSVAGPRASQPFDIVSRWLLSPGWVGCDEEQAARARLELSLREAQRAVLTLAEVGDRGRAFDCPEVIDCIARLPLARTFSFKHSAQRFLAWLEHWGWPGPLARGARAQQAVDAVRAALEDITFAGLDDDLRALQVLRQLLLERRLRAGGGPLSPVQVLDVADLPGQRFDAVRVIDIHADNWPGPARLNRLLPARIARELPRSSAGDQLTYTAALQRLVVATSDHVSFSWALHSEGVPTSPSPLLADAGIDIAAWTEDNTTVDNLAQTVPGGLLAKAAWPDAGSDQAAERDRLQVFPREPAPTLGPGRCRLPRVVQVLNQQSACPWAAFLVHRLGVRFEPPPNPFPGPAALGNGVHDALEALYRPHRGNGSLPGPDEVSAAVAEALRRQTSEGDPSKVALNRVEHQRLERLLREWLAFEQTLPWPNPQQLEQRRETVFSGFELSVRMDRLDQIEQGALILDYKTGNPQTPAWGHDRPTELQLPLYAVLMAEAGEAPAGIGLLTVRHHGMKQTLWSGDASLKANGIRSGVSLMGQGKAPFSDWDEALNHWQGAITMLLEEFRAGVTTHQVHHPKALTFLGLELLLRTGPISVSGEMDDE